MPLENTVDFLKRARKQGKCVGAFNIVDFLSLEAILSAAAAHRSPVILQTSQGTVKRYGAKRLVCAARCFADDLPIPVGIHLDHGTDLELIKVCIDAGYSSVMIDASAYPFAENVSRTRQVVEWAHAEGVSVEGEIGVVGGVEDDISVDEEFARYTAPEEAIAFQEQSGVDFLAVAIGTAHGFYKVEPKLNIDTLRTLYQHVDFPLVVHGGTGLSFETLAELVVAGASKLNISTQLKKTYIDSLDRYIGAHSGEYDPLKMLNNTYKELIAMASELIGVFCLEGVI